MMSDVMLDEFKNDVIELFLTAGMNVRKWRCNQSELDKKWAPDEPPIIKVLGYKWNVQKDVLSLGCDINSNQETWTKRKLSSLISSVFDPLGLMNPVIILLRMELPNIWSNGYDWDDQLSVDDNKRVTDICSNLEKLQDIKQDRMVSIDGKDWDLVINCDASKNAFGAVAYVVSETKRNLLMSRVKLARKTSIPELELDAIHMADELAKTLTNIINFKNVMIVSDSLINLNRLKKHPNCMESGLSLRIMKIRKLGCYIYQHTTTDKNAADLLSRGCSAKELADNNNRSGEL